MSSAFLGESACLAAAFMWATAVVIFRGPIAAWGARTTNLVKCLVATVLLALTLPFFGGLSAFASVPTRDLVFIAASGVVGLTLGDTALFAAVGRLGAHRTLVLQTFAPVFAGGLAIASGERLTTLQLAGGAVVLIGVAVVVGPGRPGSDARTRAALTGVLLALVGAFGQGAGVVLAKQGLASIDTVPATLARIAAGTAGLLIAGALTGHNRTLGTALGDRPIMLRMVPATFVGTYLALLLMMAGVALAPATIAAVLLATSPIFSLVIEAIADRRRPTALAVIGTIVAVGGVAILVGAG
ncbi:MAG: DMT family transporter [Candidatus Sulfomarinibacteraceae bacterium]